MFDQPRWPLRPWIAVAAGSLWIHAAAQVGLVPFLVAFVIALPMAGAGLLLALGHFDHRIPQTLALAGTVACGAATLSIPWLGAGTGLTIAALSAASIWVAGREAIAVEPFTDGVPRPRLDAAVAAKVAVDEVVLGLEQFSIHLPTGSDLDVMREEIDEACLFYREGGFDQDPTRYHETPPLLESPEIHPRRVLGRDYDHVRFESGYAPRQGEPGRDRWLALGPTRTAHAWLRVHPGRPRPWLVCINGYRLGYPAADVFKFRDLHERLGLNLLMPVLPLHGPRRVGRISGDGFFTGNPLDTIHAVAQAQWDIRRLVEWVRSEYSAEAIGVHGLSLGGYTAALFSGLQDGLSCSIPGIAVSDFANIIWRHAPTRQREGLARVGLTESRLREVFRVISPLEVEPLVPFDARLLFGAVPDRLVPPAQVRDLHRHWGEPELLWIQGGHCTTPFEPRVVRAMEDMLRHTKLVA